jgi:hypothetical protein
MTEQEQQVFDFVVSNPNATIADVMAEFNLSATEVVEICKEVRKEHPQPPEEYLRNLKGN